MRELTKFSFQKVQASACAAVFSAHSNYKYANGTTICVCTHLKMSNTTRKFSSPPYPLHFSPPTTFAFWHISVRPNPLKNWYESIFFFVHANVFGFFKLRTYFYTFLFFFLPITRYTCCHARKNFLSHNSKLFWYQAGMENLILDIFPDNYL